MNSKQHAIVAIIGAPNAGKSTLVNKLVKYKVSIATKKPQTTRANVKGIMTQGEKQIIFIDTPGIFIPDKKNSMQRSIIRSAWRSLDEANIICLLIDVRRGIESGIKAIIKSLAQKGIKNVLLAINKIDSVPFEKSVILAESINKESDIFGQTFLISAKKGTGLEFFMEFLSKNANQNGWIFEEDEITDAPMKFLASEITREKIMLNLHEELPYISSVEGMKWEENEKFVEILQYILVQKTSQKAIVIGKDGAMISKIAKDSGKEIEKMVGKPVYLRLFVKVSENWNEKYEHFEYFGLTMPKRSNIPKSQNHNNKSKKHE